jgi:hypothetical protein
MENWIKQMQDCVQSISDNNKLEKLDCVVVIAHQESLQSKEETNSCFAVIGGELGVLLNTATFFKKNPEMIKLFKRAITLSKIDIHKPFKKGILGWLQKKKLDKILQK